MVYCILYGLLTILEKVEIVKLQSYVLMINYFL